MEAASRGSSTAPSPSRRHALAGARRPTPCIRALARRLPRSPPRPLARRGCPRRTSRSPCRPSRSRSYSSAAATSRRRRPYRPLRAAASRPRSLAARRPPPPSASLSPRTAFHRPNTGSSLAPPAGLGNARHAPWRAFPGLALFLRNDALQNKDLVIISQRAILPCGIAS